MAGRHPHLKNKIMDKFWGTVLIVFLLLAIAFILWIAWIAPEKNQNFSMGTIQPAIDSSAQTISSQTEINPRDDLNLAGCWRHRYSDDEGWFYRNFSQDGQYKYYYGNEPKEYDGKWEWINDNQIKLSSDYAYSVSYFATLTVEKNGKGQYLLKENYNGILIEWERCEAPDPR